MGLRCLLGHDFGEPETERERNEEGNEVVVTVREVKTCGRCGEKQVVSENKEIKSIDQLRESANVGTTSQPTTSEPSTSAGTDDWSMDDAAATGAEDGPTTTEQSMDDSKDQWTAEELMGDSGTESSAADETVAADDDVDKGVAEIIESAEKDDDMLQPDEAEPSPEPDADEPSAEAAEEGDGTPVHPGQRSPDDAEEPDTSDEDAEILDDSPPEEAREQWEEQADPDEVPGRDPIESDPEVPEGEDAVIMGEDDATPDEPESTDAAEPENEPADDGPTAVEDEDAIIMGEDDPEPAQNEPVETVDRDESEAAEAADDEDAEIMGETESGHAPWPETPGEDEGHDATEPDGEPADLEFGGGVTPDQSDNEQNGAQESAAEESAGPADPATESEGSGSSVPEPNINLEQSSREAKLEYYCSECGLTQEVGNSSMRAGDICPECKKGYITERQKAE